MNWVLPLIFLGMANLGPAVADDLPLTEAMVVQVEEADTATQASTGTLVLLNIFVPNASPPIEDVRLCREPDQQSALLLSRLDSGTKGVARVSFQRGPPSHLVVCYTRDRVLFREVVEVRQSLRKSTLLSTLLGPIVALVGVLTGAFLSGFWSWKREHHQQRIEWAKQLYLRNEEALWEFLKAAQTGSNPLLLSAYNKLVDRTVLPTRFHKELATAIEPLKCARPSQPVYDRVRREVEEIFRSYRQEPWSY